MKLSQCILQSFSFLLSLVIFVATSEFWFPTLSDNRVTVLSSTIIICICYLIYDLIVNPPIKENNHIIRTKNMDRSAGNLGMVNTVVNEGPNGGQRSVAELGLRRRQAYGETERMKKLRNEAEELGKLSDELKKVQELFTSRKQINNPTTVDEIHLRFLPRVPKARNESVAKLEEVEKDKNIAVKTRIEEAKKALSLDHLQKANNELVAKLEEVEKDKKIAVESKVKLMKILDEQRQKVLCLDHVQKVNNELVAKLEKVEKDKKFMVESKNELMKILDEQTKKVLCFDNLQEENKELVAKLEEFEQDKKFMVDELMKILDEEKKKVSLLEKKCLDLEKGIESSKNRALDEEVNKKMLSFIDLIENRKDGFGSIMKIFEQERDKCKMLSDIIECTRLEEVGGTIEADDVENKLETSQILVENTVSFEDFMLGCEDDIVYVDSDGFEVV